MTPLESDSTVHSSTNSGPPTTLSPGSDAAPRVPNGAVMAATIMVNSGPFSGKSTIESTGSVGCSYSLFGDKLWRINFNSQGEFASTDTTSSGRHVVSFDLTAQPDGTGDMGVLYTETSGADDLRDQKAAIAVQDNGSSVKFNYTGRNSDGTLFHGAAMCTKPLRNQ